MIRAAAISLAAVGPAAAEVPAPIRAEMIPVAQCWNVGSLSPVAALTSVTVAFSLSRDGKVVTDSLKMTAWDGTSEAAALEAYEAARRAILRCSQDGFDLPAEQYDAWKHIEMTFDPRRMEVS
ncbi:hypothetical protein [Vannielia litorea]|uniref:hypothetical protein n=1 Tax=Vannielia litorea TaxID=1217970 RepID=UPI001BCEFEB5|nr:hypothetical protein [Vannielia litorea]MBS8225890.1 hypothetical protein [Vannielia litorea]